MNNEQLFFANFKPPALAGGFLLLTYFRMQPVQQFRELFIVHCSLLTVN